MARHLSKYEYITKIIGVMIVNEWGVRYRLYEAASLRQAFSFPLPDTPVLQLSEACLTTLFALIPGDSLATAHDGVR
jgi:hypothetical protein